MTLTEIQKQEIKKRIRSRDGLRAIILKLLNKEQKKIFMHYYVGCDPLNLAMQASVSVNEVESTIAYITEIHDYLLHEREMVKEELAQKKQQKLSEKEGLTKKIEENNISVVRRKDKSYIFELKARYNTGKLTTSEIRQEIDTIRKVILRSDEFVDKIFLSELLLKIGNYLEAQEVVNRIDISNLSETEKTKLEQMYDKIIIQRNIKYIRTERARGKDIGAIQEELRKQGEYRKYSGLKFIKEIVESYDSEHEQEK